jgi:AcrR family transcriptional regulator
MQFIQPSEPREDLYDLLARSEEPKAVMGLRESHKIEKLKRISAAARRLFTTQGYEGTTLREIAREARVALGTLGFYADDKRDLVLLMFNQDIPDLISAGSTRMQTASSDVDQLVNFFHPFYNRFAKEVLLYRTLLRDNLFQRQSMHAREFDRLRGEIIAIIKQTVQASAVRQSEDTIDLAARGLFFIYFAQVRWWISGDAPKAKAGLSELESLFRTHLTGIHGQPPSA